MTEHSRYNVGGQEDGGVLKNKLNINDQKTLEDAETILFSDAYKYFFGLLEKGKLKFDVKFIFQIHKYSLETLYQWAGKIRTVEISKGGVLFCASSQIEKALKEFEKILSQNMPASIDAKDIIIEKLAIIHCEFNAIHPFREGNGRTIRLFIDLLVVSHGFNPIDYAKSSQHDYIKACIRGMSKDYSQMQEVILKGLSK
ncbi:MAG: Fic family protein [Candidatus Peregrinibacteria bacterium]|nr:Fic family protein [Candidatus Peregrinibacteria bacterium]